LDRLSGQRPSILQSWFAQRHDRQSGVSGDVSMRGLRLVVLITWKIRARLSHGLIGALSFLTLEKRESR